MAFDPDASGGVPFDPDSAGGTAFDPDDPVHGAIPAHGLLANVTAGLGEGAAGSIATAGNGPFVNSAEEGIRAGLPPRIAARMGYGTAAPTPQQTQADATAAAHNITGNPTADTPVQAGARRIAQAAGAGIASPMPIAGALLGAGVGTLGEGARALAPDQYKDTVSNAVNTLVPLALGARGAAKSPITDTTVAPSYTGKGVPSDATPQVEQAASVERVNQRLGQLTGPDTTLVDPTGKGITVQKAAATARGETAAQLNSTRVALQKAGMFADDPTLNNDLATLVQQARAHTQTLDIDGLLTRLDDLPPEAGAVVSPMRGALYDLNNLSESAIKQRGQGPLEATLGRIPTTLNPLTAVKTMVLGGSPLGMAGKVGDKLLGTRIKTPVEQQRAGAQQQLANVGIDPSALGNPAADLQAARAGLQPSAPVDPNAPVAALAQRILAGGGAAPMARAPTPQEAWQQPSLPSQAPSIPQAQPPQPMARGPAPVEAWQQPSVGQGVGVMPPSPTPPQAAPMVRAPTPQEAWQQPSLPSQVPSRVPVAPPQPMVRNSPQLQAWQQPSIGQGAGVMPPPPTPPVASPLARAQQALEAWQQSRPTTGQSSPTVQSLLATQGDPFAKPAAPGQPDPATGLPQSPIPVNTPIKAAVSTPTANTTLPTLRPNTPQDVAAAIAQDDGIKAAPTVSATPAKGNLQYLARGVAMDPNTVTQRLQEAANAGMMDPAHVDALVNGSGMDYRAAPMVNAKNVLLAGGQPTGNTVRNPLAYAHRLLQETQTAQGITTAHPELQRFVTEIRAADSKSQRQAILDALPVDDDTKALLKPLTAFGGEKS